MLEIIVGSMSWRMLILFPSALMSTSVQGMLLLLTIAMVGEMTPQLSPGLPHLHYYGDYMVLCSEVVPVLCDLLFQVVVVQFNACVDRFGFLCCFPPSLKTLSPWMVFLAWFNERLASGMGASQVHRSP